ncbi:hypothetical protein [Hyalangium versicolor]|uniref:hypothetical protein n=1 Tax=Hyalangium versicolor TaxID=2861190 RepID=UPI001CCBEE4F|nr:hypothetical protein [Hyalangium versicolor]
MRRSWMGLATAALVWGTAGSALAGQQASSMKQEEQKASKASNVGKEGQTAVQGQHELTAEIALIKGDTLYLRKDNAIIPLKVERSTQVSGRALMRSQSISEQLKSDFREGEEVRTSFNVQDNTENVATSVSAVKAKHHGTTPEKPSHQDKSMSPSKQE